MSCNRQQGTAPFCSAVEEASGWCITQNEWHELRKMAQESGLVTSRQRADVDRVNHALELMTNEAQVTFLNKGDDFDDAEQKAQQIGSDLRSNLGDANVTMATVSIVRFISEQGILSSRDSVRQRLGISPKSKKPSIDPNVEAWNIQRATMLEVESLSDDEVLAEIDANNYRLNALPANQSEHNESERKEWFYQYNRSVGLRADANDRGLVDSFGERYDTASYTPKFINSEFINAGGTYKVGDITDVSYGDLIRVFGEPTVEEDDGDRVNAEWVLEFESPDGHVVATIYDWESETAPEFNTNWSLGGKGKGTEYVRRYIKDSLGINSFSS